MRTIRTIRTIRIIRIISRTTAIFLRHSPPDAGRGGYMGCWYGLPCSLRQAAGVVPNWAANQRVKLLGSE